MKKLNLLSLVLVLALLGCSDTTGSTKTIHVDSEGSQGSFTGKLFTVNDGVEIKYSEYVNGWIVKTVFVKPDPQVDSMVVDYIRVEDGGDIIVEQTTTEYFSDGRIE